jgi:drug/metabolite transporter (DMT)-like permease
MLAMLALGVLGNGLYQILWVEGMARTRASDAALLVAASPAFIELIGWARGHERIGLRGFVGIGISLVGIGLVVTGASHGTTGGSNSTLLGNALILASVLCWAFYAVGLKPLTRRMDGLTLSAVTMTGGFVPMLIAATPSLRATKWSEVSAAGWGAVAYSGLLALVVAYLFWYRGVRVLGPTRASMYSNLQPLFAMAAAWLLLGESPRAMQLAGALCIIGGLLLTRLTGRQPIVAHE